MKELSFDEFSRRTQEVLLARKIFIGSGITKNISDAFALYQEVLAAKKAEEVITNTQKVFAGIERPRCEECDTPLALKINATDIDGNRYPTAWICQNCGMEYYSDKTAREWYEVLSEAKKQEDKTEDERDGKKVSPVREEPEI